MIFYTVQIAIPAGPLAVSASGTQEEIERSIIEAVFKHAQESGLQITAEAVPLEAIFPKPGVQKEKGADFTLVWRPLDANRSGVN